MKIPATGPAPVALECKYCTVPVDSGDTCTFCAHYRPPAPSHTEAVVLLAEAVTSARIANEDIDDVLTVLPEDAPLLAVVDLVAARAHLRAARRILDRAAAAIGGAA